MKLGAAFTGFGLLAIIGNVLFWGGLIYFALWCLKHFEVIGG